MESFVVETFVVESLLWNHRFRVVVMEALLLKHLLRSLCCGVSLVE